MTAPALPGARFDALKAWAAAIPDFAAIPPERRTTVAIAYDGLGVQLLDVNGTHLQTALDAARAQTGGDRLVILPDTFQCRKHLTFDVNADPSYDVIVAWSRVVDGTYPIQRYVRVPTTTPAAAPRLMTAVDENDATQQSAVITTTKNATTHRWRVFGCDLRVWSGAPGDSYCGLLIDHGDANAVLTAGLSGATAVTCAQYLQLSHCWTGGVAFDTTGAWRPDNLGRVVFDSAAGFAANDCYNSEHGASSSNGSDRGFWGGAFSQGPVWINNVGGDSWGGIAYMHGGSDVPTAFPNCADFQIEYAHVHWSSKYSPAGTATAYGPNPQDVDGRVADVNGQYCPWARKNQGEIKDGLRHRWHRNVYTNFWAEGQQNAIGMKSNNQDGFGRADGVSDVTVDQCIVRLFNGNALALIGAESINGGAINGLRRLRVDGNYLQHNGVGMGLTVWNAGSGSLPVLPGDWYITNNLQDDVSGSGIRRSLNSEFDALPGPTLTGEFVYARNVVAAVADAPPLLLSQSPNEAHWGFGPLFDAVAGAATKTVTDNLDVLTQDDGLNEPGVYTGNVRVATVSALGITRGTNGLYQHDAGSMLLTAASGGQLSGPELELVSSIYDAVVAGDVRALMAAEDGTPVGPLTYAPSVL